MPILYPASLDAFTNPGAASLEDTPGIYHDVQHADANDALEAIQSKLGISETVPADTPVANAVLQSLANGRSKWAPIGAGLIAPGATLVKLASQLPLGAATGVITFSSIPQTYSKLILSVRPRAAALATLALLRLQFNGDVSANYDDQFQEALGATVSGGQDVAAGAITIGDIPAATAPASVYGQVEVVIDNYTSALQKTAHGISGGKGNNAAGAMRLFTVVGFWRSTAAITSVSISANATNLDIGTSAVLWGVP